MFVQPVRAPRGDLLDLKPLALAAAVLLSGCRAQPSAKEIDVRCEITPQPVRVGPARVLITLSRGASPVNGASVKLEGNMTHAGMAPVFTDAPQASPGQYAGTLDFNMPGDWVLSIHAKLPGGAVLDREIPVRGVEAR